MPAKPKPPLRALELDAEADNLEQQAHELLFAIAKLSSPDPLRHEKDKAYLVSLSEQHMSEAATLRKQADEIARAAGFGPGWRQHPHEEVDAETDTFQFDTQDGHNVKVVAGVFPCEATPALTCEAVRVYSNDSPSRRLELIKVYPKGSCQSPAKETPYVCEWRGFANPAESILAWLNDRSEEDYKPDSDEDFLEAFEDILGIPTIESEEFLDYYYVEPFSGTGPSALAALESHYEEESAPAPPTGSA